MSAEPRAVIYTRVSTEEQAMNNTSLEDQRDRNLRACELRAAMPVKVCEDAGISGARYTTRPGLMEALRLIECGAASLLVVTKIDRLARKASIILEVAGRIDRAGGQIVTCDGMEFGKTPVGRLMLTLLAAMAEFERDSIRERSISGRIRRALDGIQPCRSLSPYGYHIVTKAEREKGLYPDEAPGNYVIIEPEARWVRQIYTWYAEGQSLRGIAAMLDAESVPTQREAAAWRATTVRRILDNPAYRGAATFGRQEFTTGENLTWATDSSRALKSGRRAKDREKPIAEIPVPAIVDTDLWHRCSLIVHSNADDKKSQHGGNPDRKYLLTSMTRCPVCGGYMKGLTKTRRRGDLTQYYSCRGHDTCEVRNKLHRADLLHTAALDAVLHLAEHPVATAEAIRAHEDHQRERHAATDTAQERAALEADLGRLNAEIDATRRAMVQAMKVGLREADFLGDLQKLAAERDKKESRLHLLSLAAEPEGQGVNATTEAGKLAQVTSALAKVLHAPEEDYTTAEKQALLYRVIESVTPTDDGVTVKFKPLTVHGVSVSCTVSAHGIIVGILDGRERTAA